MPDVRGESCVTLRPFTQAMKLPPAVLVVMVLAGCAKVSVTPLGSTADGRRQYQVTCNEKAARNGKCHEVTTEVCGGNYETQGIANTGPRPFTSNGQLYVAPADSVSLVACEGPEQ